MRKIAPFLTCLALTSTSCFAIDALSPIERFLGSEYDPEEYSDLDLDQQKRFAPASPADSDLGHQLILQRNEGRAPVRADLSTNLFWTNNTASTNTNKDDGFIWQTRALATWKPRIGDNLFADFYLSQNVYRYDSPSSLNFERTDARVGLVKITPDLFDMLFFARYEFTRVTSGSLADRIYSAHRIRLGAHKVFLSTPKHTAYVALDYAHNLDTSPHALDRDEYSAHAGYTYQINDKMRAVLYYHHSFYDYDRAGREDTNHALGAELYWQLTKSTRLQASFTYVENDSNLPLNAADYESVMGGFGIGFTTRF